jgi:Transcriptional regulators
MQESVFTRMRQGLDSFTPSEKKIANFILNNASEASNLSVTELAKKM